MAKVKTIIEDGLRKELINAINNAVKDAIVTEPMDIESIPSGSLFIDEITGIGGYPLGRITEIFGGESAGKSTLCLTLCANAQKMDIVPVYIDVENSIDFTYATQLGVDVNKWILTQPDDAESAFRIAEAAAENGAKLIIIDSIGALVAKRETESESDIGDNQIGLIPKLISKFVRRFSPLQRKHNCALVLINQRRAKIGAMPGTSTEDTPGGMALKHAYTTRMKITRTGKDSGDEPDYITSKVDIVKNKVAPPYGKDTIRIRFGTGIDLWYEIITIGVENKIIKKSGGWYKYGDENIGQGDNCIDWLKKNKDVVKTIIASSNNKNTDFYINKLFGET